MLEKIIISIIRRRFWTECQLGRDDLLWKVEENFHALKFVHRLPRETLMSIWETLRWLPIPATSTTYVTEFLSTRQISLFPLKLDFLGGLKALYIVKPSSVTRRNIMDGMGNGLGIVYTPHQCWYSDRISPYGEKSPKVPLGASGTSITIPNTLPWWLYHYSTLCTTLGPF